MKVVAIVPAAGKGRRFGRDVEKAFILLDKKPVLFSTLKALERARAIQEIVLVVSRRSLSYTLNNFLKKFSFPKVKKVVVGGKTRTDSVWNGLQAVDKDTELVLIHDGARPFIDRYSLNKVIKAGERFGAAVLGVPITSTIKKVKNFRASETVPRKFLWESQTPQIFPRDLILNCYQKAIRGKFSATDDAQIVERYGYKVRVVEGSPLNIKITRPEDLLLAKAILKIQKSKCKNQNYIIFKSPITKLQSPNKFQIPITNNQTGAMTSVWLFSR